MYTVYAIKSLSRNYIYVGLTNDLVRRLSEHNLGYNRTTKAYAPFHLIYSEEYPSRQEAREREKFLKGTTGKRFLYELINKTE